MPIRHGNTYRAFGWLVVASLCTALYAGEASGQVKNDVPRESPESPPQTTTQQEDSSPPPIAPPQPAEPAASPKVYEPDCDHPDSREEADLCAQRRMADAAEDTIKWIRSSVEWAESQFYATIGEIAALVVTILVAALAVGAAFKANRIARESAERQLRAYVTVEAIQTHPGNDPMSYQLEWKNTGQTPAIDVSTYTNWESRTDALPDNFPYPKGSTNDAAALGPGQHVHAWPIFIPGETIERVRRGILRLYVWGAAEYNDVFKDTSRRRTEFCYEIVFDDAAAGDGQIAMGSRISGPHNGIDDRRWHQPRA